MRRFAATRGTCALALGLRLGSRPGLQTPYGRLDRGQAVCTARQLGGQLIAAPAAQGRIVRGILLVRLRHQGLNGFAQAVGFLLHIARAHRLVPRRIALSFRPIGCDIAQLHHPCLARDPQHLHKHIAEGV